MFVQGRVLERIITGAPDPPVYNQQRIWVSLLTVRVNRIGKSL